MTTKEITTKLERLNADERLQNMIAQANARAILFNTRENRENFPRYNISDDKLELLAFQYLNLGCQFAEIQNLEAARQPLETGATILENIHASTENRTEKSNYWGLIAALAYYVGFQYSKSFILIGKLTPKSKISKLLSAFLKRSFYELATQIYELALDPDYLDENIEIVFEDNTATAIYEITISRALNNILVFAQTGNNENLIEAKRLLSSLKEIAEITQDPGIWWVIRLLILIVDGFEESSVWKVLEGRYDITDEKVSSYIKSLLYLPTGKVYEFFITQRKSFQKVVDESKQGCVVSIPTSSGKTRIAEVAILDCLYNNEEAKILYIAPFRSLAFEVESSLSKILSSDSFRVSHLYGGSLYTPLDEVAITDSNIIIATPEKAKAILRGNDELIASLKLIIVDEGHLLGPSKRLVSNEAYYEELRYYIEKNDGRFLLLSAVLPNATDLAKWLTGSANAVYKDNWRPSDERFGTLEWNGERVSLNWLSTDNERDCFNRNFITQVTIPKVGRQLKDRIYPENLNEAVAATAHKLRNLGPVLIFVGRRDSVFVMAKAYLKGIPADDRFVWEDTPDWTAYQLACTEVYGANNDWIEFARQGILCHNANLHGDVRLPLERLMRSSKPRVIICTSTLGQGVNLGVSTVIFSTLVQGGSYLTFRDFWNIAGRAGRAFIDNEGKVLIALNTNVDRGKLRWARGVIEGYLDKDNMDSAQSGLLIAISQLIQIANDQNIEFERLLQLVGENDISSLGDESAGIDAKLDWIDDSLLSLHSIFNPNERDGSVEWVDDYFRKSLAFIQSEAAPETADKFLRIIKARVVGIINKVGQDRSFWRSIIKSGIPLNSDLEIEKKLEEIIGQIDDFVQSGQSLDDLIALSKSLEEMLADLPVLIAEGNSITSGDIDNIRHGWYSGNPMSEIIEMQNAEQVITQLYAFNLPWLYNGIAKKLRLLEHEECADVMEKLAILCEAGLPRIEAVKIYQAGIRSRVAAREISVLFDDSPRSIRDYRQDLVENQEYYIALVTPLAQEWLKLLSFGAHSKHFSIKKVRSFELDIEMPDGYTLVPRVLNLTNYLVNPDLSEFYEVESNVDFSEVDQVEGISFKFNAKKNVWVMKNENPYIRIIK
jgi:replicative superfamily II helicase